MKAFKKFIKVVMIILAVFCLLLGIAATFHHIMLRIESNQITPIGNQVSIDGYKMNVYSEGTRTKDTSPVIVMMSGSGISSPIYDYKVLYSRLMKLHMVAVIEKFGYGYSDVSHLPRDVKTMVEEDRQALILADIKPPYVLMPHSMSALEAIYWSITYPDEISGIIGLDLAVPDAYLNGSVPANPIQLFKISTFFGFHRIHFLNPISKKGLTKQEYKQHKLLNYRNTLNDDVYNECKSVMENAKIVSALGAPQVPTLMFTTNYGGVKESRDWLIAQRNFAYQIPECTQIEYDCGHNLHYYKYSAISEKILDWMKRFD